MGASPRRERGRKPDRKQSRHGPPRAPAKVTPPVIPNAYPRMRLFRALDDARRAGAAV